MKLDKNFEKNYFVLESILTAPHGSVLYLNENNKFIYQKKMSNQKFFKNRKRIINGVKNYISDIKKLKVEASSNYKNNFKFGKINNYLFSQMNNNIFKIDKKLFQSLYFDNLYVRVKENKISI